MGRVPAKLSAELQSALGLVRAVETGTFLGDGASALARIFPEVVTVELAAELHDQTSRRLASIENIAFVLGDSRAALRELAHARQPTLYFLDGHWSAGQTAGSEAQCPVMDEIAALARGGPGDCVIIDDARLFLAGAPPPYDASQWPTMLEVIDALRAIHPGHHITVLNDQILAVPQAVKPIVDRHGQQWDHAPVRKLARRIAGDRLPVASPSRRRLRAVWQALTDWLSELSEEPARRVGPLRALRWRRRAG